MAFVVERFVSINGEGQRAGELAYFVRFRGCNLNCSYCDTRWANSADAPAEKMTAKEIADDILYKNIRNVTLTGGEPLLQKEIPELCDILIDSGCRVEIETNGSIDISELAEMKNRPVFTLDYKLPSSNMERFMRVENFRYLMPQDTVKFVSGSIEDLDRMMEISERYALCSKCGVYISPVFGRLPADKIVEYMISHNMNGVRLQLQLHKFIWDPDKRGV